jgi:2-hydroxy-3-oxopropionate reductase
MGLLGSALTESLIKAGFTVRGYDTAPDRVREHEARGGVPARSPADAARGATVVMTCLMTADIVRDVLLGPDGAIDAAPPGLVVIDNSAIHPDASAALAGLLARRGIPMLDAPGAGSSGQARRREAPVMVGGHPEVFARCRPILDALTERVRHVGPNGAGARAERLSPWPRACCSGFGRGSTATRCSPSSRKAQPIRGPWTSRASAWSRAISKRRASSSST